MRIGIQITKSTNFRGVQQEFNNVYYYELATAVTAPADALIDEIEALEKVWHSTAVNFVRASVWSAGGSAAENQMLFQKDLSGTGAAAQYASMSREMAVLIRWPAGFDVRGLPVYLRKWYHTLGDFGSHSLGTAGVTANTAEIPQVTRDNIASDVSALNEIGGTESWDLCSKTGRMWEEQPECHPYYEHHQLGDMWR